MCHVIGMPITQLNAIWYTNVTEQVRGIISIPSM